MSAISELSHLKVNKAKTPEEKAQRRKEASRDNKAAYLFLIPWFIGLFVITIGPMLASLYLSFTQLQPDPGTEVDRPRATTCGCSAMTGCTSRCRSPSSTCSWGCRCS